MVKHVSVRFAWHDSKWNGKVCEAPERNIYCTGNYSLLSPRIQRRIDLQTEQNYKNQKISKIQKERKYVPPCYWCLNALGDDECKVEDPHPFADTGRRYSPEFGEVPPLKYDLKRFSTFSWNFKLGYAEKGSYERYVPPEELENRTKEYLSQLEKGKSIAFFYANYSNPITADDYKYLLLGAGVVKDVKEPQEYEIPRRLIDRIRNQRGMANTPTIAWQFQILLEPSTIFTLPYHEYLDLIDREKDESASNELWKNLDEVAIRIEETTIIPNFKYVSMHLQHDKAIYLLYLFRQSIRRMKEHNLVERSLISEAEGKIDNLLALAWKQRGRYPGFRNALFLTLSHDYDKEYLKEIIPRTEKFIIENFGSIESFLEATETETKQSMPSDVVKTLRILKKNKDNLKFLSLFDFSIIQFENIEKLVDSFGLETVKANPYIILENYQFDLQDSWNTDEADYGVSIYQIDIALIPDPKYADWETLYDARSPERLRALISKILYDSANQEGNSCLTREEILERIQKYPLYYITEKLRVDVNLLLRCEKQIIFKEKFLIIDDPQKKQTIYQLKTIREIEGIIEQFTDRMLKKTYKVDTKDIEEIVNKEIEVFEDKLEVLDVDERRKMYWGSLKNGLFVISGKAGSGKTQAVVNLITKFMETRKLPIFVFTPTGKANLVIRNRLKKINLHKMSNIRVSTIHRFLYRALFDYYKGYTIRRAEIYALENLISDLLSGKLELIADFRKLAKGWSFNPKVVIIDETSMVDEILLAVLFSLVNPETLEHLILVGDERQLPPIGVGRPFVDLIFNLKQKGLETNFIHLESNLRFDPSTRLGMFSELFSGQEQPSPVEIEEVLNRKDDSLEIHYFGNATGLRNVAKQILNQLGCVNTHDSLFEMFVKVFESEDRLNLDEVQIITPRRIGDFGSMGINRNVVLDGMIEYAPNTKLICEENMYFNVNSSRILGLANGSIGYIRSDGNVHFDDIDELVEDYGYENLKGFRYQVSTEVYSPLKTERKIDLGYAITVHKSQGSDFEHVILVFSQVSPFITRELLYTAFTRPKTKLHFVVHHDLKNELPLVLIKAYANSLVEQRKTLLFGHKTSPFKPYKLTLKDQTILEVDSKIEWIIAKALDKMDIGFEYGPKDFLAEYHLKPDFKLPINGKVYYIEHLGRMDNIGYRERWLKKFEIYKNQLGIADILITTSESEETTDVEENVEKIIEDIKSDKLLKTEGFSYHHYEI